MHDDRFRRHMAANEILFKQGDVGDCAYVVETGLLEVAVERGQEREVLSQVGPGSLLGEMALLDNGTRMATVKALAPCTLRVLTRRHLGERLDLADPLLRHILHLVITRYREVVQRRAGAVTHVPSAPERKVAESWERDTDRAAAIERLQLEQELEIAIDNAQLVLHYQPIMRLDDETVAGFEALVRWSHPKRGLVMPDAFIPFAEQTGLIVRLGHCVIREAVAALAEFDRVRPAIRGVEPLFMTVNLSGRQFADAQLVPVLEESLKRHGIAPRRLLLEITESSLVDRVDAAAGLMRQCDALGVRLSVDDFGTGYSALSYLYRLPVSSLKLARAFIQDLAEYPASQKIIGAIARLAKDLGMDVVSEGIEIDSHVRAVRGMGVRYGQGFYYAGGMPAPAAAAFVRQPPRAESRRSVLTAVQGRDR